MLSEIQKYIPPQVKLVAVSKGQPVAKIAEAYAVGQRIFGENYVKELVQKAEYFSSHERRATSDEIQWHFIGHLQKNKINKVLPHLSFLHSLDSIELAIDLETRLTKILPCCLEVNFAKETSKSGVLPENVEGLVQQISTLKKIDLVGLMTIPPPTDNPETSRIYFRKLRLLAKQLKLSELSMGMSHDYKVAIEEGATMVRIGTAIFGARGAKK